jgi:hypothetical protein
MQNSKLSRLVLSIFQSPFTRYKNRVLTKPAIFRQQNRYLHGLSIGSTANETVEQLVKRAGVSLHNWWSAVNQFLNLIPFFREYDCFMAVFNDFPFLMRNDIIGVGANPFLVYTKKQMSRLIKGISQDKEGQLKLPIVQRNTVIEGYYFLIDLFFPTYSNLLL